MVDVYHKLNKVIHDTIKINQFEQNDPIWLISNKKSSSARPHGINSQTLYYLVADVDIRVCLKGSGI